MNNPALNNSTDGDCMKELMRHGRNNGFVTTKKLMACHSPDSTDQDQIEDIVSMIEDMGIQVKD